jgi:hypothetical protein
MGQQQQQQVELQGLQAHGHAVRRHRAPDGIGHEPAEEVDAAAIAVPIHARRSNQTDNAKYFNGFTRVQQAWAPALVAQANQK